MTRREANKSARASNSTGIRFCAPPRAGLIVLFAITLFLRPASPAQSGPVFSELPEAPPPQMALEANDSYSLDSPSAQNGNPAPPATRPRTPQDQAAEQIREQERQRALGIMPMFNTTYRRDAVSLTRKQKMSLAFRSAVDPVTFGTAFVVAGIHEGLDDDPGFGWGAEGYFKRSGAVYLDAFNGTMIGNGILPSLLHQDPRYFRLGHGKTSRRFLYATATTVICKHDNTGKWEPNYSNVIGNVAAGAISNLYYPTSTSFSQTIANALVVTAEGTAGALFQEFWPDISRKWFHKDPTHGLDDLARKADKADQRPEETKKPTK